MSLNYTESLSIIKPFDMWFLEPVVKSYYDLKVPQVYTYVRRAYTYQKF